MAACHYPRGLFDFVEGVARYNNRVIGYAVTLVTDIYPPLRLAPENLSALSFATPDSPPDKQPLPIKLDSIKPISLDLAELGSPR